MIFLNYKMINYLFLNLLRKNYSIHIKPHIQKKGGNQSVNTVKSVPSVIIKYSKFNIFSIFKK